ncbi:MAG TPA: hypothetical protein VNC60_05360 [Actinomycetota bacterium]|nr:hypothetical protein [Actinomycetota bacterium]
MDVRGTISGFDTDTELVGIDVRPATGKLTVSETSAACTRSTDVAQS